MKLSSREGRFSVCSCQLSVVSCQLSVVGCRLSVVGWKLEAGSLQIANSRKQEVDSRVAIHPGHDWLVRTRLCVWVVANVSSLQSLSFFPHAALEMYLVVSAARILLVSHRSNFVDLRDSSSVSCLPIHGFGEKFVDTLPDNVGCLNVVTRPFEHGCG